MLPNASQSASAEGAHVPVMAQEVLDLLEPRPGDTIVDCTFGAGGHAAVLEPLTQRVELVVDRDAKRLEDAPGGMALAEAARGRDGRLHRLGQFAGAAERLPRAPAHHGARDLAREAPPR